jgi:hypothetical protein
MGQSLAVHHRPVKWPIPLAIAVLRSESAPDGIDPRLYDGLGAELPGRIPINSSLTAERPYVKADEPAASAFVAARRFSNTVLASRGMAAPAVAS